MNRPDIAKMINDMAQHRNVHPRNFMKVVNYVSELELALDKLQKGEHYREYNPVTPQLCENCVNKPISHDNYTTA